MMVLPSRRKAMLDRCQNVTINAALTMAIGVPLLSFGEELPGKVTFQDHVFPIFEDACLNCHNPDEEKGGLDLSTYGATLEGGSGGEIVSAGDPAGSRILLSLLHREEPFMPPKKPMLEKPQLDLLSKWIEGGLLDNPNSKPKKKSIPDFAMTLTDAPIGKPEGPPPMPEHLILEPETVTARASAVLDLASSPWAPLVALTSQKQILLYHTETRKLLGVLPFPEGFPESVTFSRNGSLVLAGGGVGGKSGKAVAWDIRTGQRVVDVGSEFDTVLAADISPDQSQVALGGPGRNIKIFDTKSGAQVFNLKKHPDWLLELAYSPDGKFLASGGRSGALYIWDPPKGIEFFTLKGHTQAITGLAWRDDSKILASCSEDGQVILWELKEGKQVKKWDNGGTAALSIHFAHNGNLIVSGRDRKAKIYDQNGKMLRPISPTDDIMLNAAFTHDDKHVITSDWTGAVQVWDEADSKELGKLDSNPPAIAVRLESLETRKGDLDTKHAAAKTKLDGARKKKAEAEKRQTDINAGIPKLVEERKVHDARVSEVKSLAATLQKESDVLKASVAFREKAVPAAAATSKEAQQKYASLQTELAKWRQQLQAESNEGNPPPSPKPGPQPEKTVSGNPAAVLVASNKEENPAAGESAPNPDAKPQPAQSPAKSDPAPQTKAASAPAPSEAKVKVAALTPQVAAAQKALEQARAAEAKAAETLKAESTRFNAKTKDLQEHRTKLATEEKAVADLVARIAKLQEEQKALNDLVAKAGEEVAAAQKEFDAVNAESGTLSQELAFWKAQHFNLEVASEAKKLEEMVLNQPAQPAAADRATLESQKIKVEALRKQYLAMLPK